MLADRINQYHHLKPQYLHVGLSRWQEEGMPVIPAPHTGWHIGSGPQK